MHLSPTSARRARTRFGSIITHGWPGSVIELLNVIDPLVNPTAHAGARRMPSTW